MLAEVEAVTALVLWGLALELFGVRIMPPGPMPTAFGASLQWAFRAAFQPQLVLAVAWLIGLVNALARGAAMPAMPGGVAPEQVVLTGVAVLGGLCVTLPAALLGPPLRERVDQRWVDRGGGAAMALIGLRLVGVPVPSVAPLVALVGGAAVGFVVRTWHNRR